MPSFIRKLAPLATAIGFAVLIAVVVASSVSPWACTAGQAASTTGTISAVAPVAGAASGNPAGIPAGAIISSIAASESARFSELQADYQALHDQAQRDHDAAIASGKREADLPKVPVADPPLSAKDWAYGIAGIVLAGSTIYNNRQAAKQAVKTDAGLASVSGGIVQAVSNLRAGVPIATIAKNLEDQNVPIDLTHPTVVAAIASQPTPVAAAKAA